ncbi:MAG: ASPIC/UnbV domain-containing protein [Planctomycetota bacterium]
MFAPRDDAQFGAYFKSNSLSGGERHRLFLRRGGNFKEATLISGADFREDGRGFTLFDFDQDGFMDIGVTSPNHPRFRILKNEIVGERSQQNGRVAIKLVGGQTNAEPSDEWSPRDAYGATILATVGATQRMFQLSLGEGLSGQNSKYVHVGLGSAAKIDSVEIHWPSGKITRETGIPAGQQVTLYENPAHRE